MIFKNWITTLAGILALLLAVLHCYEAGKLDLMCIQQVLLGGGLIAAKDFNVTGGTK